MLRREHDVKAPGDPVILELPLEIVELGGHERHDGDVHVRLTCVVEVRSHSVISSRTSDEQGTGTPGRRRPQSLAKARS
jgi:hypothetical protein